MDGIRSRCLQDAYVVLIAVPMRQCVDIAMPPQEDNSPRLRIRTRLNPNPEICEVEGDLAVKATCKCFRLRDWITQPHENIGWQLPSGMHNIYPQTQSRSFTSRYKEQLPTMRSPTYQSASKRQRLSFSHPNRNGLFAASPATSQPAVALPPGHFLSLPATHATPSPAAARTDTHTNAHTVTPHLPASNLAPNVSTTASADFEVDVRTGFLPFDAAVERLPSEYDVWEEALWAARGEGVAGQNLRLGGDGIREQVWRKGVEEVSPGSHHYIRILVLIHPFRCLFFPSSLYSTRCRTYVVFISS